MPALQPPSMQIGALPTGYGPSAPAGPALAYGAVANGPALVQQKAGNSTAAAPAAFTLSAIPATTAGTFLVMGIAYAQSGAATVSTPAGWTVLASASSAGNTIGGRILYQANNPGGITSVALSALTGINGIAVWFAEFSNVFAVDAVYGSSGGAAAYNNSSTAPAATAYSASAGPLLLVGFETDVTGQAYTAANVGAGWVTGTTATSTLGATNAIIRPFFVFTSPIETLTYQLAGTLAGAIANGTSLVSLICSTTGPLTQPQPQAWPAAPAVAGAWGALGGTKPGGAGSGQ